MIRTAEADRAPRRIAEPRRRLPETGKDQRQSARPMPVGEVERVVVELGKVDRLFNRSYEERHGLAGKPILEAVQPVDRTLGIGVDADSVDGVGRKPDDLAAADRINCVIHCCHGSNVAQAVDLRERRCAKVPLRPLVAGVWASHTLPRSTVGFTRPRARHEHMDLSFWWLFPAGIVIAAFANGAGIGGATFFSPLLVFVVGLEPVTAVGVALGFAGATLPGLHVAEVHERSQRAMTIPDLTVELQRPLVALACLRVRAPPGVHVADVAEATRRAGPVPDLLRNGE